MRLLIYELKDGRTRVASDLPSSLMSDLETSKVSEAAGLADLCETYPPISCAITR